MVRQRGRYEKEKKEEEEDPRWWNNMDPDKVKDMRRKLEEKKTQTAFGNNVLPPSKE